MTVIKMTAKNKYLLKCIPPGSRFSWSLTGEETGDHPWLQSLGTAMAIQTGQTAIKNP